MHWDGWVQTNLRRCLVLWNTIYMDAAHPGVCEKGYWTGASQPRSKAPLQKPYCHHDDIRNTFCNSNCWALDRF